MHAHLRDAREPHARGQVDARRLVRGPALLHAEAAHHVQREGLDAGVRVRGRQQEGVARRRARGLIRVRVKGE
eukprot:scaffold48994_cov42-Phaeocystis_antarctica.AAC.1